MNKLDPYTFKEHFPYRISRTAINPAIAGKAVIFLGWRLRSFDIRRAVVRILEPDGSAGEEWLVNPSINISL
jgi:hypothetical protein